MSNVTVWGVLQVESGVIGRNSKKLSTARHGFPRVWVVYDQNRDI